MVEESDKKTVYVNLDEKSQEQLIAELKAGFSTKYKELLQAMMHYTSRYDFEAKLSTCRFALYIAEDFESKEKLEKYTSIFQAIVYGVAWANGWINDE